MGRNFAFHLGYVGNATRRNLIMIDTNAPLYFPNADVSTAGLDCRRPYQPYRTTGVASTTTCTYAGYLGSPATSSATDLAQKYAGERFGIVNERVPALNGNYNSLQATLRGKIGSKLDMFATYVWSKTLTYDAATVDNHDLHRTTAWPTPTLPIVSRSPRWRTCRRRSSEASPDRTSSGAGRRTL